MASCETGIQLTFAPGEPEDVEVLFRLSRQLIDQYEDVDRIDYEKVLRWVRRKIEAHITEYVRVMVGGEIAVYYRFQPCDGKMELDDLYILPSFRCRGIGTRVLEKCRQETDLPIFLYVFVRNVRAIALYQRMGFRIVKAAGETRYIMEQ